MGINRNMAAAMVLNRQVCSRLNIVLEQDAYDCEWYSMRAYSTIARKKPDVGAYGRYVTGMLGDI